MRVLCNVLVNDIIATSNIFRWDTNCDQISNLQKRYEFAYCQKSGHDRGSTLHALTMSNCVFLFDLHNEEVVLVGK